MGLEAFELLVRVLSHRQSYAFHCHDNEYHQRLRHAVENALYYGSELIDRFTQFGYYRYHEELLASGLLKDLHKVLEIVQTWLKLHIVRAFDNQRYIRRAVYVSMDDPDLCSAIINYFMDFNPGKLGNVTIVDFPYLSVDNEFGLPKSLRVSRRFMANFDNLQSGPRGIKYKFEHNLNVMEDSDPSAPYKFEHNLNVIEDSDPSAPNLRWMKLSRNQQTFDSVPVPSRLELRILAMKNQEPDIFEVEDTNVESLDDSTRACNTARWGKASLVKRKGSDGRADHLRGDYDWRADDDGWRRTWDTVPHEYFRKLDALGFQEVMGVGIQGKWEAVFLCCNLEVRVEGKWTTVRSDLKWLIDWAAWHKRHEWHDWRADYLCSSLHVYRGLSRIVVILNEKWVDPKLKLNGYENWKLNTDKKRLRRSGCWRMDLQHECSSDIFGLLALKDFRPGKHGGSRKEWRRCSKTKPCRLEDSIHANVGRVLKHPPRGLNKNIQPPEQFPQLSVHPERNTGQIMTGKSIPHTSRGAPVEKRHQSTRFKRGRKSALRRKERRIHTLFYDEKFHYRGKRAPVYQVGLEFKDNLNGGISTTEGLEDSDCADDYFYSEDSSINEADFRGLREDKDSGSTADGETLSLYLEDIDEPVNLIPMVQDSLDVNNTFVNDTTILEENDDTFVYGVPLDPPKLNMHDVVEFPPLLSCESPTPCIVLSVH